MSKRTKKAATLKDLTERPENCSLVVDAETKGEGTEQNYRFKGSRSSGRQSFVLLLHSSAQECTLHPVSDEYKFNLETAPSGSPEITRLAEYPKIEPTNPVDEVAGNQVANISQATAIDIAGTSPLGEAYDASSDSGDASEADESNPFDFRRYLDDSSFGSQPSSPDLPTAPNTKDSTINSSEHSADKSKKRPSESRSIASTQRKSIEARPQQNDVPVPEVRLDRRASTHNEERSSLRMPKPLSKTQKKILNVKNAETAHESPKNKDNDMKLESRSKRDEDDAEDEADETDEIDEGTADNALEIVYGDDPAPPTRGREFPISLAHDLNGPISLRSAANSASPSSRLHTPLRNISSSSSSSNASKRRTANEDVIEFAGANQSSEDEVEQPTDYPQGFSEEDDARESNLPTTAHPGQPQKQFTSQPQSQDFEDEDDADLEAEMREGLADADEDIAGGEVVPPPESESESEAE